ncbi:MAG TPA: SH3 domain-containing protein [Aggregatilinea sp.]|uniref:SH3 domain-containing protein n=1 Tax=Aggregatilinea sp. TaxID=2806333 RepID=UPI002BD250C5|nr:SH3 domain-containing protein [Aggregatilinea sp.]HML22322.1 SH3 domain-containing protein [Aggregatilinea sp.]
MNRALSRWLLICALAVMVVGGLGYGARTSHAAPATWYVQIYSTPDWTGAASEDPAVAGVIDYTWADGVAPTIGAASSVNTDGFSIRFTGSDTFATAGVYQFTLAGDERPQLIIDGITYISTSDWASDALSSVSKNVPLTAGSHTIVVQMKDTAGNATIQLTYPSGPLPPTNTPVPPTNTTIPPTLTPTPGAVYVPSTNAWYAEFFNNLDMSGTAAYAGYYPASGLNLSWGQGSPNAAVQVDNFSARFTRTINIPADMPAGTYKFYARADDAFRFYINNNAGADYLLFDFWGYKRDQMFTADFPLSNGSYTFRFEYQELSSDASLFLTWSPPNAQSPVLNPDGSGSGATATKAPGAATSTAVPGGPTSTVVPTGTSGTVNVAILNFRASPSLSAQILQKLSSGFTYGIQGKTPDSTWLYINVNGTLGWVMAQYLTITGDLNVVPTIPYESAGISPTATPSPIPAIELPQTDVQGLTLANLYIRSDPLRRAPTVGLIPWNTTIQVYGKDAGHSWYLIAYNGVVGWSYAPLIRLTQGAFNDLPYLDGSVPVYAPVPTQGIIAQAFGNMRIRSGPGLTYTTISRAQWGTRVEVLGISANRQWLKIRHGDVVGWSSAPWYRIVQGSLSDVPTVAQ